MKFPTLKYPRFCRLLSYIVVLIPFIAAFAFVFVFNEKIPTLITLIVFLVLSGWSIYYMIKNFIVLMTIDYSLAFLSCYRSARTQYDLRRSPEKIERTISHFGKKCEPIKGTVNPDVLRYKYCYPITVYSSGIEKVMMCYHVDLLDKDSYNEIIKNAFANSNKLIGKTKPIWLEKAMRSSPLNRVTVAVIFAKSVDSFMGDVFDVVTKSNFDGIDKSFLPCVIDISRGKCYFNSMRLPFIGFGYPAVNRGIRMIRRRVFGGRLPLKGNGHYVTEKIPKDLKVGDEDFLNKSLWQFWKEMKKEMIDDDRKMKKRFDSMKSGEVREDDDFVYIKVGNRGVCLIFETDEEKSRVSVDDPVAWDYPKVNQISKSDREKIKGCVVAYFGAKGYTCNFDYCGDEED